MPPDLCADISALIHPLPENPPGHHEDDAAMDAVAGQVVQEREETAEALRAAWDYGDCDPLLTTLERLRAQRLQLEGQMRLLIAYGRRFTHPRPYKLIDLADAAGMSISGVRTAYEIEEIEQATAILGRSPDHHHASHPSPAEHP
jgi:hypothetical protein